MGMFDTIEFKSEVDGHIINDWQTYDLGRNMGWYKEGEVVSDKLKYLEVIGSYDSGEVEETDICERCNSKKKIKVKKFIYVRGKLILDKFGKVKRFVEGE